MEQYHSLAVLEAFQGPLSRGLNLSPRRAASYCLVSILQGSGRRSNSVLAMLQRQPAAPAAFTQGLSMPASGQEEKKEEDARLESRRRAKPWNPKT